MKHKASPSARKAAESWSDRPLTELTGHLVHQHHHFVRHELGRAAMQLSDLCEEDDVLIDLLSLHESFIRLAEILLPHLSREETGVFPAIEAMEKAWQSGEPVVPPSDLHETLSKIATEHGAIAEELRVVRDLRLRLRNDSELPPRCGPLLDDLATIEAHLHEYMFLEDWLVFPRAAALAEQSPEPAAR
jgi:iron-sulfur cluster repair protein YtfE (RIC family)